MSKACMPCCGKDGELVRTMLHIKRGKEHILFLEGQAEGAVPAMFKATADYAVGDSFLLNGESYTPVTQDGTALRAQFFKAGGVVNVAVDTVTKRLGFPIGTAGTGKVPVEAAGKLLMGDEQGNIVSSGKTADDVGAVKSVFGRTGEVTAQPGDYTAAMVGAAVGDKNGAALNALSLGGVSAEQFAKIEVGTWPGKFKGIITAGDAQQTITQASYCKIGPLVTVTFDAVVTNWGGATGGAAIDGLPYVCNDLSATPTRGFIGTSSPWIPAYVGSQKTYSRLLILKASNLTTYDVSEIKTPTRIIFTASYMTDLEE